jgi:hypothetical protein
LHLIDQKRSFLNIPSFRHFQYLSQQRNRKIKGVENFFKNFDAHLGSPEDGRPLDFFNGIVANCDPRYRDFYRNLVTMHYFLDRLPKEKSDLRARLVIRALNYLAEFSPPKRPETWQTQLNPMQKVNAGCYARYGNIHLTLLTQEIARTLAVDESSIFLVTDDAILQSLEELLEIRHDEDEFAELFSEQESTPHPTNGQRAALPETNEAPQTKRWMQILNAVCSCCGKRKPDDAGDVEALLNDRSDVTSMMGRDAASIAPAEADKLIFSDVNAFIEHLRSLVANKKDGEPRKLEHVMMLDLTKSFAGMPQGMNIGPEELRQIQLKKAKDGKAIPVQTVNDMDVQLADYEMQSVQFALKSVEQFTRDVIESAVVDEVDKKMEDIDKIRRLALEGEVRAALKKGGAEIGNDWKFTEDDTPAQIVQAAQSKLDSMNDQDMKKLAVTEKARRIMAEVDEAVVPVGLLNVGPQTVLYLGRFLPRNPVNWLPPEDEASGASKDIRKKMRTLLRFSGYFPLENQVMGNWSELADCDLEKIFEAARLANDPEDRKEDEEQPVGDANSYTQLRDVFQPEKLNVHFPDEGAKLCQFDSVDSFLSHPALSDFDQLSDHPEIPVVRVLAKATIHGALNGLRETSIEGTFSDNGLNQLLQNSYNRIIACMRKAYGAIVERGRLIEFTDEVRLIYEELANIVLVASPFTHSDFEDAMRKKMAFVLEALPPNIRENARFHLQNGGMRCLNSIRSACIKQKKARLKNTELVRATLTIGGQELMYFQNRFVLDGRQNKRVAIKQGESLDPENLRRMFEGQGKIDLLIIEFHPNASTIGLDRYATMDAAKLIKALDDAGVLADEFTATLDITIPDAERLKAFMTDETIQDLMQSKRMNTPLYWSAQKYEFLGMDNNNGGFIVDLSDGSFPEFSEYLTSTRPNSLASLQGITFLLKTIHEHVTIYQNELCTVAARMHDPDDRIGFPKEMFMAEGNEQPIQVCNIDEEEKIAGFVHLKMRKGLEEVDFAKHVSKMFEALATENPEQFPIFSRAGFGFFFTNLADIMHSLRLTPGLEGDERLARYRDHLVCLNEILREQESFCQNTGKPVKETFELALQHGLDLVKLKLAVRTNVKDIESASTLLEMADAYQKIQNTDLERFYRDRALAV